MKKNIFYWLIAVLLTIGASVYQRVTGPTNPKKAEITINGKDYKLKFPRSASLSNRTMTLNIEDKSVEATLYYKTHNTDESFCPIAFEKNDKGLLTALLPEKQRLDKIDYYVTINSDTLFANEPLVIRYKDDVPATWLILHIILMFASMLFAAYGFVICIANRADKIKRYLNLTTLTLFVGGFVFGFIVQKYAFGVCWSGFPFGTDITDNKTLIALIALLIALPFRNKSYFRYVAMASFIAMFAVFCIPHSIG
jgi:hypothetical protein